MRSEETITTLVKSISQNNCEASFNQFFHHFYPRLFEIAVYYTKNPLPAEEVVSDVFLEVWKQRERLGTINNIPAYLCVMIKNRALNYLRKTKHAPSFVYDLTQKSVLEVSTPEDILLNKELLQAIHQTVQQLPEKCRLVYKLVKEEKCKYREVAKLLDISEKTVEMHVGKALRRIRETIENIQQEPQLPLPRSSTKSTLLSLMHLLFF